MARAKRKASNGDGNLKNLGNGVFKFRFMNKDGKRETKRIYSDNDVDAREQADLLLAKVKVGKHSSNRMSFEDLCDDYLLNGTTDVEKLTVQGYRKWARTHLKPAFGTLEARNLEAGAIKKQYGTWLREGRIRKYKDNKPRPKGLSKSTVHKYAVLLNLILDYGVETKVLSENVARGVKMPKVEKKRHAASDVYSWSEVGKIIRAAEAKEAARLAKGAISLLCPVIIAIFCGLRRGEIFGLRWSDLNLDQRFLFVRQVVIQEDGQPPEIKDDPKNKYSERPLSVSVFVIDYLRKHHAQQAALMLKSGKEYRRDLDLVFPGDKFGNPYPIASFNTAWTWVVKKAGVKFISLHDLRHTNAHLMFERDLDLHTIKERLGHDSIETTSNIYLRGEITKQNRAAADALDEGAREMMAELDRETA